MFAHGKQNPRCLNTNPNQTAIANCILIHWPLLFHARQFVHRCLSRLSVADLAQGLRAFVLSASRIQTMSRGGGSCRRHPWEEEDDEIDGSHHAWEASSCSSGSDEEAEDKKTEAARLFLEELLDLYMISGISAMSFCVLCWFASQAGVEGQVGLYGLPPGRTTGKYQAHLNSRLGFDEMRSKAYHLATPGQARAQLGRGKITLVVRPPHEAIAEELSDPAVREQVRDTIASGALPPAYFDHPAVKDSASPVAPLAIYMDGVSYSLVDSVLGVWLINLATSTRHLISVVRKRCTCVCGCTGWCTYYPLLCFIRWGIQAFTAGIHPQRRHDGAPWSEHDVSAGRADRAGRALPMPCALIFLKGDWAEFCARLGVPTWANACRPCFLCSGFGKSLYSPAGISLDALPFRKNTDQDFEEACRRCEIWVLVEREQHKRIISLLRYDKRPGGVHGRALRDSVAELGLRANDRLEPNELLADVADFERITSFPARVLFWRRSRESLCTRRCPLFDEQCGVSIVRSVALDVLHTLHLGVMLSWCKLAMWALIDAGVWGAFEPTEVEKFQVSVLAMNVELTRWYRTRARERPDEELTRCPPLHHKMLGTPNNRNLKAKAAQTWGLLLFLLDSLLKYDGRVENGAYLREAGCELEGIVRHFRALGWSVPWRDHQQLVERYKRHLAIMEPLLDAAPKHHLMVHLLDRAGYQGNPARYSTFADESLNKELKKVLRLCHQANFEIMAFTRIGEVLRRLGRKRVRQ